MADILSKGYWIMPNTILFSKDLTDKQKLLYCLISSLCAENGYCRATNEYLWELLNASKITISKNISILVEKWFIYIEINQNYQRKITLVKNDKGDSQKWQGGDSQKWQDNITSMNITIEYIYANYYWKTKWIDEKVCNKLIDNKLKQWSTLDTIYKCMVLYGCDCSLNTERKFVKKFETWITEFQPLDEEQMDMELRRIARDYKQKSNNNPKFQNSKSAKTIRVSLCDAFGEQKVREIWKTEWKKEISLNLR